MLSSIDVKFVVNSACFLANVGNKGVFRSANILQIADVVCRVVFLLFLLCFQPTVHLLCLPISEMFRHFLVTTKTTQPHRQVFSLNRLNNLAILLHHGHHFSHSIIAKCFQIWLTIAGSGKLCMDFQPIRNGEIFAMNNNSKNGARSLF